MPSSRPIVAITMGDPVGVGPEILLRALEVPELYRLCRPLVVGDRSILSAAQTVVGGNLTIASVGAPEDGTYQFGSIDLLEASRIGFGEVPWGRPTLETSRAMVDYIKTAADLALTRRVHAIVTCPINKLAMQMGGYPWDGHTELLSERTQATSYAMMLAGDRLRVVLVTIHAPLHRVPVLLTQTNVLRTIRMTHFALTTYFGIPHPRLAVAGLNPHAGEGGKFGEEEIKIIQPAVKAAQATGWSVDGPLPPDTVYYNALEGHFDAVVSMYHDQGLIPFKMVHFKDGVNMTLGLPIIRTSVDHGTAYDIAGTGRADAGSLIAAVTMAAEVALRTLSLS